MPRNTSQIEAERPADIVPKERDYRPVVSERPDRRTKAGRLFFATMDKFTQAVGGKPDDTQQVLIERIAWLTVHISRLDTKLLASDGSLPQREASNYLAWTRALNKAVVLLKIRALPPPRVTLAETLADLAKNGPYKTGKIKSGPSRQRKAA